MDDVLLIIMPAGVPVGVLILLDIAMVIRFGWSASALYPPALRHLDAINGLAVRAYLKDQEHG